MSLLDHIDVLVLTWNEEANIGRTLDALVRFPRVVVLDSGSTDGTLGVVAQYANARVCTRAFDHHAAQWNHGLAACGLEGEWVLALDADFLVPAALVEEIAQLDPPPSVNGYRARFSYCVQGQPLRGSLYPALTVLFRREGATCLQDGHANRLAVRSEVRDLDGRVFHDDRKSLAVWLAAQDRYARLECDLLLRTPWRDLSWRDRLRSLVVVTPWLVPLYCLTVGRGLLDGWHGWYYALQRGIAESLLALRLLEARMTGGKAAPPC